MSFFDFNFLLLFGAILLLLRIKAFYGASENRGETQAWHGLIGLRARGDYQKTTAARPKPVQNSADSQRDRFRKNPNSRGVFQRMFTPNE
ncbi:MAG: hypothetical protein DMF15_01600 [Verrucomicrobia bacterium]|nr:MAG: hypothetical protein DMF15_01600 [Verrucomicrobiota bacterium]PYT65151.1 MAG: hypothetical protein DMG39_30045 [Acidobacteriota bacterium]